MILSRHSRQVSQINPVRIVSLSRSNVDGVRTVQNDITVSTHKPEHTVKAIFILISNVSHLAHAFSIRSSLSSSFWRLLRSDDSFGVFEWIILFHYSNVLTSHSLFDFSNSQDCDNNKERMIPFEKRDLEITRCGCYLLAKFVVRLLGRVKGE